jgi:ATP-binding cassette, subfamily B, multidrug efflux pump
MIKLLWRNLRPYWLSTLVIIGLLFTQANAELKLPDLMSDIVNTGIQQGGVTDVVPTVIRQTELEKLVLFVSAEDAELILSQYTLIDQNDPEYVDEYPVLEDEPVYRLTLDGMTQDELAELMAKPFLVVMALDSGMIDTSAFPLPPGVSIYDALRMMPAEQKAQFLMQIDERFSNFDPAMLNQSVTVAIKAEYTAVGLDMEAVQMNYILSTGVTMLLISLMAITAAILVGLISSRIGAGLAKTLRKSVFSKVESFSNVEFDQFSTASLITRTGNDINQIQMMVQMMFRIIFYAPILGSGAILRVMSQHNNMTWIVTLGVVVMMSLIGIMFAFVLPKFALIQKLIDRVNLVARESLSGLMVVRAFGNEPYEESRFDKANLDLAKINLFVNRAIVFLMPTMMFIMNGLSLLIVWYGGIEIDLGNLQVGDMMAFMQYAMQIIMSFMMIAMTFIMIPRASVSAKRVNEVLDTPLSITDPITPAEFNRGRQGEVVFENVTFRYPNADDDVLHDLSFTARSGETTAFIGSTGSGKSTLINLIPRFYDVSAGRVLVNGVDVREVRQKDLRQRIGYIPQKGVLFSGTIESNLKYAKEDATETELQQAITIAQAANIIAEKADGVQEHISQGGTNVSGGQKQRLSIARALIKNPDLFIFDDSFSALDFKTDLALRSALHKELSDKTLLVVAQRISTILHADQIIVLENGRIVGKGTHRNLMDTCDVYREIALSQMTAEELSHE